MNKYEPLWNWIRENGTDSFSLTFDEIEKIAGLPLDHAFLNARKELPQYGYKAGKISLKGKTVGFEKVKGNPDAGGSAEQKAEVRKNAWKSACRD